MELFDISQYAPHVLAAICLIGIVGLPSPTVQRPNTWHMTMLIVGAVSLLNILLAPTYSYFQSAERLSEISEHDWLMGYAYIYAFIGTIDAITFLLIRKFSQKGRAVMALLMSGAIIVNVFTSVDIVMTLMKIYQLDVFGVNLLAITDTVYSRYEYLILSINVAQIMVLLKAYDGWSRNTVSSVFSALLSFVRGGADFGGVRARISLVRYQGPFKGLSS